jgi:predicted metalloprotease with PDZ domain
MVLDVFDRGPADKAGIGRGCLLTEAQGVALTSRRDLEDVLQEPGDITFTGRSPGSPALRQFTVLRSGAEPVGAIIAPGLGDQAFVTAHTEGPLLRLLKKAFGRI